MEQMTERLLISEKQLREEMKQKVYLSIKVLIHTLALKICFPEYGIFKLNSVSKLVKHSSDE